MRAIHSITHKVFVLFAILSSKPAGCNPITNSNLNDHIREFASKDDINSTRIKTLQKEELGRYASFAPVRNPVRFKDTPDNALSSSSYSRELLHHEQPGYPLHDYEDSPHISYGYDYIPDTDTNHHGFHHYPPDHYHGHHDHHGHHGHHHNINYHHKHYDHALAAKTILWPIAGLAILGAAAALVSNPVLLQLGVVSGRKRRDTVETLESQLDSKLGWLKKKDEKHLEEQPKTSRGMVKKAGVRSISHRERSDLNLKNIIPDNINSDGKKEALFLISKPTVRSRIKHVAINNKWSTNIATNGDELVPVPLLIKENT